MNTKKLSNIILGSALILGLGASNGSFAQNAAQQIIVGESAALISQSQALASSAQAILGAPFTGAAAQVMALEAAANSGSAEGRQFAALLKQQQISGKSVFHINGSAARAKLAGLRTGVMALATKVGFSKAQVQMIGSALGSPVGQAVIGNQAAECVTKWSDPTAQKSAVGVFLAMGQSSTVAEFQKKAVENVQANFKGESFTEVEARVGAAMNSANCDIARVKGLRAARSN